MKKDYYKTLGVTKTSSADEIKKAYRKMAMKYHPDRTNGDKSSEAQFKEIGEAYEVLSDENKKMRYDHGGDENTHQQQGFSPNNFNQNDFHDIFSQFFNSSYNSRTNYSSRDVDLDLDFQLSVSLEQAVLGAEIKIELPKYENIDTTPIKKVVPLTIRIPAGVDNGTILTVSNEGNSTKNKKGNLNLKIKVTPQDNYTRKNYDLYLTQKVDFVTVLLGGEINVESITGNLKLKIPECSKNLTTLRLKGKGIKKLNQNEHGDLYVVIDMITPNVLSKQQKDLLKKFNK